MAEMLQERGFETAAVVSAAPLARRSGLDAGFDRYDEPRDTRGGDHHFRYRSAGETTALALDWLATEERENSLLWVHYFDPHQPLNSHQGRPGEVALATKSLYAGEIAYMDQELGRLLDAYRDRGDWEDTLVIVVGDHGEGRGDHGEDTHGHLVHEATTRIPFIVKPPSRFSGDFEEDEFARGIDVLPTVLDVAGIDEDLLGSGVALGAET